MFGNRLRGFAAAFIFLFAVGYATQSPGPAAAAQASASHIDKVLADAVARHDIPGVVAMAADGRRVLYQGAFGIADQRSGRRLTMDAIFRIASMTKPVTSVAAMQLFEQGKFTLEDPAEKYLPELAHLKIFEKFDSQTLAYSVRTATGTPTIRQLL